MDSGLVTERCRMESNRLKCDFLVEFSDDAVSEPDSVRVGDVIEFEAFGDVDK